MAKQGFSHMFIVMKNWRAIGERKVMPVSSTPTTANVAVIVTGGVAADVSRFSCHRAADCAVGVCSSAQYGKRQKKDWRHEHADTPRAKKRARVV